MPFAVTEENASALEPLFKPWEEPVLHRLPNPTPGGPAIVQPGRRPSKCPLVRSIRAEVDRWRRGGYAGVSETSRILMNFWFNTEHTITDEDGDNILFHYHWAQREAIETIIYLYELRNVRSVAELMFEFGDDEIADLALGINPDEDRSIMRLGTLLFCLSYAKEGGWGASGVWKDVEKAFAGTEMAELYSDLEEVNSFRNTRVAHVETRLSDEDEAWEAMRLWLRCLNQMVDAAS